MTLCLRKDSTVITLNQLISMSHLRLVKAFSLPDKFLLQVLGTIEAYECGCPDSAHVLTTEKIPMEGDAASFTLLDTEAMAEALGVGTLAW